MSRTQSATTPSTKYNVTNLSRAKRLYGRKHYKEALQVYRQLLTEDPNNASAQLGVGACLLQTGQVDAAYSASLRASELDHASADPLVLIATVHIFRGELQEAEQALHEALQIDPQHARAYDALGIVYYRRGEIAESISAAEKAIELAPGSWQAHYNLGIAYLKDQEPRKAIRESWLAFRISPSWRTASQVFALQWSIREREYDALFSLLFAIALCSHSEFTWPLIILASAYWFALGLVLFSRKRRLTAAGYVLIGIFTILTFIYMLYYLPPIFR